ncbi:hypothetical protein D083_3304 [Dickeya solani RNS 08.23.3.1.A]|nr:hypothetical protein D083_3304 [Dickeya solani RNS 08.23.3.1.A]
MVALKMAQTKRACRCRDRQARQSSPPFEWQHLEYERK